MKEEKKEFDINKWGMTSKEFSEVMDLSYARTSGLYEEKDVSVEDLKRENALLKVNIQKLKYQIQRLKKVPVFKERAKKVIDEEDYNDFLSQLDSYTEQFTDDGQLMDDSLTILELLKENDFESAMKIVEKQDEYMSSVFVRKMALQFSRNGVQFFRVAYKEDVITPELEQILSNYENKFVNRDNSKIK